eukprot:2586400-Rhodomonas_salina.4
MIVLLVVLPAIGSRREHLGAPTCADSGSHPCTTTSISGSQASLRHWQFHLRRQCPAQRHGLGSNVQVRTLISL